MKKVYDSIAHFDVVDELLKKAEETSASEVKHPYCSKAIDKLLARIKQLESRVNELEHERYDP